MVYSSLVHRRRLSAEVDLKTRKLIAFQLKVSFFNFSKVLFSKQMETVQFDKFAQHVVTEVDITITWTLASAAPC